MLYRHLILLNDAVIVWSVALPPEETSCAVSSVWPRQDNQRQEDSTIPTSQQGATHQFPTHILSREVEPSCRTLWHCFRTIIFSGAPESQETTPSQRHKEDCCFFEWDYSSLCMCVCVIGNVSMSMMLFQVSFCLINYHLWITTPSVNYQLVVWHWTRLVVFCVFIVLFLIAATLKLVKVWSTK